MLSIFLLISQVLGGFIEVPIESVRTSSDSLLNQDLNPLDYSQSTNEHLNNYGNTHYVGKLNIGNPLQEFNVIFDTTNSWLWVPGTDCSSCKQQHIFASYRSDTFYYVGQKATLSYDGYIVSGYEGKDTVYIGDYELYATQTLLVLDYQHGFDVSYADGALGLGFKSSSDSPKPFLKTLKDNGMIDDAIFSIYLNDENDPNDLKSTIILGGYDAYRYSYTSHIDWMDIKGTDQWEIILDYSKYDGKSLDSETTAVFNSTSVYIYAPEYAVDNIYKILVDDQNNNCYYHKEFIFCSCYSEDDFDSIELYLDGFIYELENKDLFKNYDGECQLQIKYWDNDYWSLGFPFLRKFYTIYNMDTMEIGIAGYADTYDTGDDENDDDSDGSSSSTGKTLGIFFGAFYGLNLIVGIVAIFRAYNRRRNEGDYFPVVRSN